MVVWMGIEIDRTLGKHQATDLIGLPTPQRRLRALPLGLLRYGESGGLSTKSAVYLDRGGLQFPTVGDPVRLPTPDETRAAVPGIVGDDLTIPIGRATLAAGAEVHLSANRLFGRHLAVLGNTGSGKSCSIAHLLRAAASATPDISGYNAIVLDLNGEYSNVFDDLPSTVSVRRFTVHPGKSGANQFRVPYWLWNYREWLSFTEASSRAQAPQLRHCLQLLRTTDLAGLPQGVVQLVGGRRIVRRYQAGPLESAANQTALSELDNVIVACSRLEVMHAQSAEATRRLRTSLESVLGSRRGRGDYRWQFGVPGLNLEECSRLLRAFDDAIRGIGVPDTIDGSLTVGDSPVPFDAENLVELLPIISADSEAAGWVAPLVERLRISMADQRQRLISGWIDGESLENWLQTYAPDSPKNQIAVIDLSLVPSHVLPHFGCCLCSCPH